MKKILLTISVVASSIVGVMAQAPDFGFETWIPTINSSVSDPQGSASLNSLTLTGTAQSVFKETTAPFAGTASAKITTVKVIGAAIPNPYASGNLDTAGLLVIGSINFSPPGINYGYTCGSRPAALAFESKYTPIAGDSAFILVYLTKWTGSSRDTVATGKYATGTATTSYAPTNLVLTYNPAFASIIPDSERVFISSSVYAHHGAKIGSTFYVDAFAWTGYNSTNDINGLANSVSIYPNPANNNINFTCSANVGVIEIADITGRSIGSYFMNDNKITIQTSAFAPGIYMYNMLNDKKEIINRGKFEVVK